MVKKSPKKWARLLFRVSVRLRLEIQKCKLQIVQLPRSSPIYNSSSSSSSSSNKRILNSKLVAFNNPVQCLTVVIRRNKSLTVLYRT